MCGREAAWIICAISTLLFIVGAITMLACTSTDSRCNIAGYVFAHYALIIGPIGIVITGFYAGCSRRESI